MIFADLVTLAKAGWSPKQVKELLEMCETSPEVKKAELPKEAVEDINKVKEQEEQEEINAFAKLVNDNKEE